MKKLILRKKDCINKWHVFLNTKKTNIIQRLIRIRAFLLSENGIVLVAIATLIGTGGYLWDKFFPFLLPPINAVELSQKLLSQSHIVEYTEREQFYKQHIEDLKTVVILSLSKARGKDFSVKETDEALWDLKDGKTEKAKLLFAEKIGKEYSKETDIEKKSAETARYFKALTLLDDNERIEGLYYSYLQAVPKILVFPFKHEPDMKNLTLSFYKNFVHSLRDRFWVFEQTGLEPFEIGNKMEIQRAIRIGKEINTQFVIIGSIKKEITKEYQIAIKIEAQMIDTSEENALTPTFVDGFGMTNGFGTEKIAQTLADKICFEFPVIISKILSVELGKIFVNIFHPKLKMNRKLLIYRIEAGKAEIVGFARLKQMTEKETIAADILCGNPQVGDFVISL